jgi:hypothetical protein
LCRIGAGSAPRFRDTIKDVRERRNLDVDVDPAGVNE